MSKNVSNEIDNLKIILEYLQTLTQSVEVQQSLLWNLEQLKGAALNSFNIVQNCRKFINYAPHWSYKFRFS